MKLRQLMAAYAICIFLACKPLPEESISETKTIGELSGGLDSLKSSKGCIGKDKLQNLPNTASSPEEQQSIRRAIDTQITFEAHRKIAEDNISALPHEVMNRFLAYGYSLRFVKDINSACSNKRSQPLSQVFENRGSVETCVVESFAHDEQNLELNIKATPKSIRNNTVLAVMSIVGERFDRVNHGNEGFTLSNGETVASASLKEVLSLSLIHEGILTGNSDFKLLRGVLPKGNGFWAKGLEIEDRFSLWQSFYSGNAELAKTVSKDIFNNVADSFYCNNATKSAFKNKFPITFDLWRDSVDQDFRSAEYGAALVGEILDETKTAVSENASSESALGLRGFRRRSFCRRGWGWGHRPYRRFQPVRNIFRARNNQMARNLHQTGFRRPRLAGYRRAWNGSGRWHSPPRWGRGRIGWRLRR